MKRITKKRWFGPKNIGWGPAPKSREGWIITIIWLVSIKIEKYNIIGNIRKFVGKIKIIGISFFS